MDIYKLYNFFGFFNDNPTKYSICYSILIFIVLLSGLIVDIIKGITVVNFGFVVYKLNYVFQYIILHIVHSKVIKYKFYENTNFHNVSICVQVPILLLNIMNIYKNTKLNYTVYEGLIINISDFYGIHIYFSSVILFILVFVKLLQEFMIINNNLRDKIDNNTDNGLVVICNNIIEYKYILCDCIDKFNYIFNFFTLLNIFSLSFICKSYNDLNKYILYYNYYILCSIFIVIGVIKLIVILYMSKLRNNLLNYINSPLFVKKFIKKHDLNTLSELVNIDINNINYDNDKTVINILEENSTSVDWIILSIALNNEWIDFNLCGVKVQSINCITKIFIIVSLLYKYMI